MVALADLVDQGALAAKVAVRVRKAQAGRRPMRLLLPPANSLRLLPAKALPRTANVAGAVVADLVAASADRAALVAAALSRRMLSIAGKCCASMRRPAT